MKDFLSRLRGEPREELFATASPQDAEVLRRLASAGADLTRPLRVTHRLSFPAEELALRAATIAETEDRQVTSSPAAEGRGWRVTVEQVTVASPQAVDAARVEFERLATGIGGTYDGWDASPSA